MIRGFHLADFLTLGNAACGTAAVFLAMLYVGNPSELHFFAAAAMAPAAIVFDVLDGKVARARQQHSALGRELDSLADVISFGVAPATLAFARHPTAVGPAAALRCELGQSPAGLQQGLLKSGTVNFISKVPILPFWFSRAKNFKR